MTRPPHAVPRVTRAEPLPGLIRSCPEDFFVEELAAGADEPDAGDHVHLLVEKRGISTSELVERVARALGLAPASVGYAGRKDARAVTRQTLSVEHVDEASVAALELAGARVLATRRRPRKLRLGDHRGNRFRIVLRESAPERLDEVRVSLSALVRHGLPNAFGPQRFGHRGDSHEIGAALLAEDAERAVRLVAGAPGELDTGPVREARERFDAGDFAGAARTFPRGFETAARVARSMARNRGRARHALAALSRGERRFFHAAWQASVFNAYLATRLHALDAVEAGDLLWDHGADRVLVVEPDGLEDARARTAAFELSPTGPLPGTSPGRVRPGGAPLERERAFLAEIGADALLARAGESLSPRRRPLRVRPTAPSVSRADDDPDALVLDFALPPGSFATALLSELCGEQLASGTMRVRP